MGPLRRKGILQVEAEQEQRTAKRPSCVSLPRLLLFLCLAVPGPSPVLRVSVQAELPPTPAPAALSLALCCKAHTPISLSSPPRFPRDAWPSRPMASKAGKGRPQVGGRWSSGGTDRTARRTVR